MEGEPQDMIRASMLQQVNADYDAVDIFGAIDATKFQSSSAQRCNGGSTALGTGNAKSAPVERLDALYSGLRVTLFIGQPGSLDKALARLQCC